jgi:cellobiose phosphorylase
LRIAPVVPEEWPGFTAIRRFRGATYRITVIRQGAGNVATLRVDGKEVEGDIIPLPEGKEGCEVQVTLG